VPVGVQSISPPTVPALRSNNARSRPIKAQHPLLHHSPFSEYLQCVREIQTVGFGRVGVGVDVSVDIGVGVDAVVSVLWDEVEMEDFVAVLQKGGLETRVGCVLDVSVAVFMHQRVHCARWMGQA